MSNGKKYVYKVYNSSGTYIKDITKDVISLPSYTQEINTPASEMNISLSRNIDEYGEGYDIDFNNIIKVYITDKETTDTLFFQGKIISYTPNYDDRDRLDITLWSAGHELDYLIYKTVESSDQAQLTTTSTIDIGPDSTIAQSFISAVATMSSISISLKASIASTVVEISLRRDASGVPDTTVVTNSLVTHTITSTSFSTVNFAFSSAVTVTIGDLYWLVVKAS
ncbi:MAG: hypothetical protein WCJ60_01665 [bacterium]